MKGGESGAVIIPGKPDESLLIESVKYENLEMPPDKKLSEGDVKILVRWIKLGAPWPVEKGPVHKSNGDQHREKIWKAGQIHWTFQPIMKPDIPDEKHNEWARNAVDLFVLSQQHKAGISASPRADKRTLLRRAYFDLLGMPPTPAEADEFYANQSPDAFSDLVDRLLKDHRYGERWGRHWLDVARYADSKGAIFGEPRQYPYGTL